MRMSLSVFPAAAGLCLSMLALGSNTAHAQSANEARVDSLFAAFAAPGTPGCAVAIVQDGKVIYQKAFGYADIENDVPLVTTSVFDIGSNAKQFTATCILLLEEEGKLSLDEPIQTYLPEFPTYEWPITLRHLLTHTSGLRDYLDLLILRGQSLQNEISWPDAFKLITSQKGLNFKPGDQQLYCNTGWVLLSEIVHRVSGKPFQEFARERIFEPLGMTSSFFIEDNWQLVKHRTTGYVKLPGGEYLRAVSLMTNVGDGGLFSTVEDLAKWDANFYRNKLGKGAPRLLDKLRTPTILNDGDTAQFCIGLVSEIYRGVPVDRHGGAFLGFRADLLRFPQQHVSVIVLANNSSIDAKASCFKIAEIYLENLLEKPEQDLAPQELKAFRAPESMLADKNGSYRNPVTGTVWNISRSDSILAIRTSTGLSMALAPVAPDHFKLINTPTPNKSDITFLKQPDGTHRIRMKTPNQSTMYFEPMLPLQGTLNTILYAGEFKSDEVSLILHIQQSGDSLFLRIADELETSPIRALSDGQFIAGNGTTVLRFERDQAGTVERVYVSMPRARDILFIKYN